MRESSGNRASFGLPHGSSELDLELELLPLSHLYFGAEPTGSGTFHLVDLVAEGRRIEEKGRGVGGGGERKKEKREAI